MELQWSLLHHRSSACLAIDDQSIVSRQLFGQTSRCLQCRQDLQVRPFMCCSCTSDLQALVSWLSNYSSKPRQPLGAVFVSRQGRHCGGHVSLLGRTQHRRHLTCMHMPFISSHCTHGGILVTFPQCVETLFSPPPAVCPTTYWLHSPP